jgi:hypothetical protein
MEIKFEIRRQKKSEPKTSFVQLKQRRDRSSFIYSHKSHRDHRN